MIKYDYNSRRYSLFINGNYFVYYYVDFDLIISKLIKKTKKIISYIKIIINSNKTFKEIVPL